MKASRNFRDLNVKKSKTLQDQLIEKGLVPIPVPTSDKIKLLREQVKSDIGHKKEDEEKRILQETLSSAVGMEFLYGDFGLNEIKMAYPHVTTKDVGDSIHGERWELHFGEKPIVDEFYKFACRAGFAMNLFVFQAQLCQVKGFAKYFADTMVTGLKK